MRKGIIIIVLLIAAFIGGVFLFGSGEKENPQLDEFAKCLTEKGVKMWGAYWCSNCNSQKKEFGKSWQYIEYVECSLPGGQGQTQECQEAEIQKYPTWEFEDGERLEEEVPFEVLAEKTGCELPN